MSKAPTCATCRHWLPRETPAWAARMGMACCAVKNTKAVTLAHWRSCASYSTAPADELQRRGDLLASLGVVKTGGLL